MSRKSEAIRDALLKSHVQSGHVMNAREGKNRVLIIEIPEIEGGYRGRVWHQVAMHEFYSGEEWCRFVCNGLMHNTACAACDERRRRTADGSGDIQRVRALAAHLVSYARVVDLDHLDLGVIIMRFTDTLKIKIERALDKVGRNLADDLVKPIRFGRKGSGTKTRWGIFKVEDLPGYGAAGMLAHLVGEERAKTMLSDLPSLKWLARPADQADLADALEINWA